MFPKSGHVCVLESDTEGDGLDLLGKLHKIFGKVCRGCCFEH